MKLPFMPDNQQQHELDAERRQMDYGREQTSMQVAEGVPDQILMQQQADREDLLKWQQDLYDELDQLKHDLRCEVQNNKGVWVKQRMLMGYDKDNNEVWGDMPPIMNNIGIRKIESTIRPFLSRNIINSNLSEERVLDMLKRVSDTLVTDIGSYGDVYDLDFGNYSMVIRWIKNVIMAGPHRAMHGWNKKIDSTISKRVETFSEGMNPQQPKKKMFGIFG